MMYLPAMSMVQRIVSITRRYEERPLKSVIIVREFPRSEDRFFFSSATSRPREHRLERPSSRPLRGARCFQPHRFDTPRAVDTVPPDHASAPKSSSKDV
jgi:hypothetical protein